MTPALKCVPSAVFRLLSPALYLYMTSHQRAVKQAHRLSVGSDMISAPQMEREAQMAASLAPETKQVRGS